jgi:ABC-type transport system involved in multi-copper enzyme maturation permease subunit
MNGEPGFPGTTQVIAVIARREVTMALRRRLVKLLFIGNLIPPLAMAVVLIVTTIIRGAGVEGLEWDPLVRLLQIQAGPVLLLALGIGTPLVARDRGEDVLFLYATRPVSPWSYTIGKMLAVAVPAVALLVLPGVLMAVLRAGLMSDFGVIESLVLVGKVAGAGVLLGCGYAGVSVGPSAATKKTRWALLLAFLCFLIPSLISELVLNSEYALDPGNACDDVIAALFNDQSAIRGLVGGAALLGWGALGALVTAARVRREMIP